jgi:hypothetical protein
MQEFFELFMLLCFGCSWPISVWKSWHSGSTRGKSVFFIIAIVIGYLSGILGKLIGGDISYVLVAYLLNLSIVSVDLVLYFINRTREARAACASHAEEGK